MLLSPQAEPAGRGPGGQDLGGAPGQGWGKTIWCTLELPPQHHTRSAVARSYRRRTPAPPPWPPALTGRRGGLGEAMSPPGLDLMWTKLAPTLRAGLIPRARLQSLLQTGVQAKLCYCARRPGPARPRYWPAASGRWGPGGLDVARRSRKRPRPLLDLTISLISPSQQSWQPASKASTSASRGVCGGPSACLAP